MERERSFKRNFKSDGMDFLSVTFQTCKLDFIITSSANIFFWWFLAYLTLAADSFTKGSDYSLTFLTFKNSFKQFRGEV